MSTKVCKALDAAFIPDPPGTRPRGARPDIDGIRKRLEAVDQTRRAADDPKKAGYGYVEAQLAVGRALITFDKNAPADLAALLAYVEELEARLMVRERMIVDLDERLEKMG